MAEPYVPIASYNSKSALLAELEVATNEVKPNADIIQAAGVVTSSAQSQAVALQTAKLNFLFLGGA